MGTPGIQTLTTISVNGNTMMATSLDPGGAIPAQAPLGLIASLWGLYPQADSLLTTLAATASSYTLSATGSFVAYGLTGSALTLTISMPTTASFGAKQGQLYGFSVDKIITALTVTASGGGSAATVDGAPTSSNTGSLWFAYNAPNNTWYRYV